ncbi:hypothetical protein DRN85_10965, partial [Methanosarcinales archaeon]
MSFLGPSDDDIFRDPPVGVLGGKYGLTKIDSVTLGLPSPFTTLKLDSKLIIGSNEHEIYQDGTTNLVIQSVNRNLILQADSSYGLSVKHGTNTRVLIGTNIELYSDVSLHSGKSFKTYRSDDSKYYYFVNAAGTWALFGEDGAMKFKVDAGYVYSARPFIPTSDNAHALGMTTLRWKEGFINTYYHKVTEKSSDFNVAVGDGDYLVDASAGPVTATLPSAPDDGMIVPIQKVDSSSNAVTISCSGTDTFWDGTTSITLVTQWQYVILEYHSGKWYLWDPAAVYSGAHKLFYNSG